jgi:hypothetical protein
VQRSGSRRQAMRLAALGLAAMLPAACVAPEGSTDPFAGAWTNGESHRIAFRDNTVVQQPANGPPTAMSNQTCGGQFRFGYGHKSREALLALTPQQPDLRDRLARLLVRPDYQVAELGCGEGDTTYVLLDDRDLVAIYRDAGIAGVEQLSRS